MIKLFFFASRHRQQILELRQRIDALQRDYLSERQNLSTKLLNAIHSQQVDKFYPEFILIRTFEIYHDIFDGILSKLGQIHSYFIPQIQKSNVV